MVEIAQKRNQQFVETGVVTFQTASLTEAKLAPTSYDTIFAININDFWTKPEPPLSAVRHALSDEGQVYLFYETPSADRVAMIEDKLMNALATASFDVVDRQREGDKLLCVIARKTDGDSQP